MTTYETNNKATFEMARRALAQAMPCDAEGENSFSITVGELLFKFDSFERWVNKAKGLFRSCGVSGNDTICVDSAGRICTCGKQFMRARDEGTYPIRVYRAATGGPKGGEA